MKKKWVFTTVLFLSLTGSAMAGPPTWTRPGMTQADFDSGKVHAEFERDKAQCAYEANLHVNPWSGFEQGMYLVNQDRIKALAIQCMEVRGWRRQ